MAGMVGNECEDPDRMGILLENCLTRRPYHQHIAGRYYAAAGEQPAVLPSQKSQMAVPVRCLCGSLCPVCLFCKIYFAAHLCRGCFLHTVVIEIVTRATGHCLPGDHEYGNAERIVV